MVGEAEVEGEVAVVGLLFLALDDGEGGVDVADVGAGGDAVEVEIERVEFGAQAQAAVGIPRERRQRFAALVHMA